MVDLSLVQFFLTELTGLLTGFAKSGISGLGILIVPLIATSYAAKASVGILLPMLIAGDLLAIFYYRRFAQWKMLFKILPITFVGIIIGYFIMDIVSDGFLKKSMGIITIILILIHFRYQKAKPDQPVNLSAVAPVFGILAGITTLMANAAGPLMTLYFLFARIKKREFIGTSAWFFFTVNVIKVPLLINLNLISLESIRISLMTIPAILIGFVAGVLIIKRINQPLFEKIVLFLALAGGVNLLLPF